MTDLKHVRTHIRPGFENFLLLFGFRIPREEERYVAVLYFKYNRGVVEILPVFGYRS